MIFIFRVSLNAGAKQFPHKWIVIQHATSAFTLRWKGSYGIKLSVSIYLNFATQKIHRKPLVTQCYIRKESVWCDEMSITCSILLRYFPIGMSIYPTFTYIPHSIHQPAQIFWSGKGVSLSIDVLDIGSTSHRETYPSLSSRGLPQSVSRATHLTAGCLPELRSGWRGVDENILSLLCSPYPLLGTTR